MPDDTPWRARTAVKRSLLTASSFFQSDAGKSIYMIPLAMNAHMLCSGLKRAAELAKS
jgi:hypothetical protein